MKCVILITRARAARNEGASARSYFSGLRPRSSPSIFASPLAAREIEIARATIPKKNNDFSRSRDIYVEETNGRSVGRWDGRWVGRSVSSFNHNIIITEYNIQFI